MLHSSVYEPAAAEKLMHFDDPAGNTIPITFRRDWCADACVQVKTGQYPTQRRANRDDVPD
jgi:hypothetical protein